MIAYALRHATRRETADAQASARPDGRRALQLAFAGIWLLDAALQYQPIMFTRAFGQTLAAAAMNNPAAVGGTWDVQIGHGLPDQAAVSIVTDTVGFCRLVANRVTPARLGLHVTGDPGRAAAALAAVLAAASTLALD